jgi:choline dehydrogenase-like flavoprotein
VFVDGRYISADTWYDRDGTPFQPQVHYFVGGATKMYGAALYRLRPADFGAIRHADGISPAWPVSYQDFEPWYTRAEAMYQVHGEHGTDPTEGAWSEQYPWPPVAHEPRIQQISDALTDGGYHPFHAPCGILLDEANRPASHCIRCATCDGYPCMVHAKADADIVAVRPLLNQQNVTLVTGAEVVRLQTDQGGRAVTGVVVDRGDGKEEIYSGDIMVLAAGAANTAKILLRSASDACPTGLANGSDQVGRNYMYHLSKAVSAFGDEPNDTVFQKTLAINDFYLAGDGRDYPLGNIQMLGNRVTVDSAGNVHLSCTETNASEAAALYAELQKILNHVGLAKHHVLHKNFYMSMNIPVAACAHQAGTCRFGEDPATSVLDVNCKAHEVDNLYVADTSFFPSIGAVNPALTAIANGIRVGEHIAERLGVASKVAAWAPAPRMAPGSPPAILTTPGPRTDV